MQLKQKLAIRYIRARLNILALVSPRKAAIKAFSLFTTPFRRSRKKAPPIFEKGESLSFKLEGHTVRGHRWFPTTGYDAPLKTVLIAHGFESSSRNFDLYIIDLLRKGYKVLAFDAPAHGESGGKRIPLTLYIKVLQVIYRDYGPVHSYIGHSFGGLALALFVESIEHNAYTKLALIAPAAETVTAVDAFFQLLRLNEEVRREMEEWVEGFSGHPFSYYSIRRALHQVQADILWVQDEDDPITPLRDALLVKEENYPNVRFILTKGLGHRKIYRDPEVMKQVLTFINTGGR
jgi:pimeloyl-ACP methyl ester carboxylesterase